MSKLQAGFKVGQMIRAFDFAPMKGRRDRYVEGPIIAINPPAQEYSCYVIRITKDTFSNRVGDVCYIPMQTMVEFEDRIKEVKYKVTGYTEDSLVQEIDLSRRDAIELSWTFSNEGMSDVIIEMQGL